MPSSYTPLLRLTLPADGELVGTWGQTVNNGITSLEEAAIAGTASVALVDANYVMTTANGAADVARNAVVRFTGALTAQRDIIVPSSSKTYIIRNETTGGFGLNVKTAAGAGFVVPAGARMLLYCDGVNVTAGFTAMGSQSIFGNVGVTGSLTAGAITAGGTISVERAGGVAPIFHLGQSGVASWDIYNPAGTSALAFLDVGAAAERMRIDANGNVGIGTSSPGSRLHLFSAAAIVARAQTSSNSDAIFASQTALGNWASGTGIGVAANCWQVYDLAAGAERMRIDTAGNVGIGRGDQAYRLDVAGSSGNGIRYTSSAGIVTVMGDSAGTAAFMGAGSAHPLSILAGGAERMRIDAAGNVGIGTSLPDAKLGVNGSIVSHFDRSVYPNISGVFQCTGDANGLEISSINSSVNRSIVFMQGSTWAGRAEAMRINTAGNVGIGTSSPDSLLQVNVPGANINTRVLRAHIGGASTWVVNSAEELGVGYSGIRSVFTGADKWALAFTTGTSSSFGAGTQPERMRIDANGYLTRRWQRTGSFTAGGQVLVNLDDVLTAVAGSISCLKVTAQGSENGSANAGVNTWLVMKVAGGYVITKDAELLFGNSNGYPVLTISGANLIIANQANTTLGGWGASFELVVA